MNIPDDADGKAMKLAINNGSDVSKPMEIDFMIACSTPVQAEKIAPEAAALGYSIKISVDEGEEEDDGCPPVTCYCTKTMFLDYQDLIISQDELDRVAQPHGGYIDGWGTFGNSPVQQRN